MQESKSNWACVTEEFIQNPERLELGRYASYWFHKSPRRVMHCMSYYKFAAKMIGKNKRAIDIGCNEGLGTFLLAKECGYAKGVDFDAEAIRVAEKNFQEDCIDFTTEDVLESKPAELWDAAVSFDVIEHILPENASNFFESVKSHISSEGIFVVGTPSLISQEFASEISKKGHVNIYSHERLEKELKEHFTHVFLFAANDEVVHTGYLPLAHYYIAVACKKK